jgi:Tfp pilus assembly protein PilV
MFTDRTTHSTPLRARTLSTVRARTAERAAGRAGDQGVTLIEVMVAFVVLMIALIPLSYLFTTSLVQAGQSKNQQAALSIAERWTETLSNTSPPVNPNSGAVIVDTTEPPSGPSPTFTQTVTGASNGHALNAVSSISVTSTANFAAATAAAPQVAQVTTGTGSSAVIVPVSYTSTAGNVLTCATNPCSSQSGTMSGPITQTEIATPTESRGGTTYTLTSKYEWETVQNSGLVSTTSTSSVTLPLPTSPASSDVLPVASVANFTAATPASPQSAKIGGQTVFYTGTQTSPSIALTGVTGGTGTFASGTTVKQNPKPNLCTSGTPQLLKLTVTVSWGPNADANQVQDSVMINYPPFGVQTLGFLALQFSGDSAASDAQGNPWSERVTSIPVTLSGPQVLNLYPDPYGCVFAQVKPGTYTVSVGQPVSGYPAGSTYGSPVFVANAAGGASTPAGSYTGHVWSPPSSLPQGTVPTITVVVGSVTRVQAVAAANYPAYDQGSTINLTYPSTTAVEDGVDCLGAGQITCVATGQNANGNAQVAWSTGSTWSTVAVPGGGSVTRITSEACTTSGTACVGVGYGTNGAVIVSSTTGAGRSLTADSLTGLGMSTSGATLTQVTCPSPTQCVAVGTTSAGVGVVLTGTITVSGSSTSDAWVSDPLPATTSVSGLQCPVGATGCVAIGTTSTGPVLLSGPAATGNWVAGTLTGFTISTLTQVTCPTATACLAIGTGKVGSATTASPFVLSGAAASGLGTTVSWTADTISGAAISALSSIVCPSGSKCLVVGTGTTFATSGALVLWGSTSGTFTAEYPLSGANPVTALTQMLCPSTTTCVAIGTNAGTPVIFTGTISASSSDTWHLDTVPNGGGTVSSLTEVACPASGSCLIMATGTLASSPVGFLIDTANLGGTTTSWSAAGLPSSDNILYFDDIDCTGGASGTCSAVGATPTGAVVLTSTGGPSGSWADVTPAGISGNASAGVPVEINNSGLNSGLTANQTYVTAVTAGGSSNATALPVVFPFLGGYNLFAGDCPSESNAYDVVNATTIPGGISGSTIGMPSPTVPLGLASLQVNAPLTGLAHAGVTVSLKTTAVAGCGTDTYNLPTTGADGLSRTAVPYGSYSVFLNGSTTAYGTLVVSGNTETLSGATAGNGTYVLPNPVQVVQ